MFSVIATLRPDWSDDSGCMAGLAIGSGVFDFNYPGFDETSRSGYSVSNWGPSSQPVTIEVPRTGAYMDADMKVIVCDRDGTVPRFATHTGTPVGAVDEEHCVETYGALLTAEEKAAADR